MAQVMRLECDTRPRKREVVVQVIGEQKRRVHASMACASAWNPPTYF
jgi:hypothetical protein